MKTEARKRAEKNGRRAETLARLYLQTKGYRVVAQRYKTPKGEIDLIMRKRKTLVFAEVKQRDTVENAHESLHPQSLRRVLQAADIFTAGHPEFHTYAQRFDAVFVFKKWHIRHVPDAWRAY